MLDERREIMGISAVVVHDTVYVDGEIAEDTYDWYAQDVDGNVWYLGEDTYEYEDGQPINAEGHGSTASTVPFQASSCRPIPPSATPTARSTTQARPRTWARSSRSARP